MKHALIIAHPNPDSFTHAVAEAYAQAVRRKGGEVLVRDLYAMGFDPCLKAHEIPDASGYRTAPDVMAEREKLDEMDVFALVYPWWFNAPPAILKGYVDRVFSMGFGYEPGVGGVEPLLTGRRMISFSLSGAPDHWVRETGALHALMSLFDHHVGRVCGLTVLDHVHFGGIVPNMTRESAGEILDEVRKAAARCFRADQNVASV